MISGMKNNKTTRILVMYFSITLIFIIFSYASFKIWFKVEINQISEIAMKYYVKDKVESLILLAVDEEQDLKLRNNAIWALGKTRDLRSIPALKGLLTGQPCNHNIQVCLEDLKKAIQTLEGNEIDLFTYK
jgi:hypothetical protein